jgi:hypothetical protein
MTNPADGHRTTDLYYAAYLKVAGIQLQETVREGGRVFFVFENQDTIDDLKQQYFNRKSKVAALSYADEIKAMKALTHDAMGKR